MEDMLDEWMVATKYKTQPFYVIFILLNEKNPAIGNKEHSHSSQSIVNGTPNYCLSPR
jgi:hypothetical protein